MAFGDPIQWVVIAVVVIALFLWGPQKIPDLARALGRARKEFDNATKEFQKVSAGIQNGTSPLFSTSPAQPAATSAAIPQPPPQTVRSALPPPVAKTGDQLLIEAARRLGIPSQGKTREQIQQDIIAMAQHPAGAAGASPPPKTGESAS